MKPTRILSERKARTTGRLMVQFLCDNKKEYSISELAIASELTVAIIRSRVKNYGLTDACILKPPAGTGKAIEGKTRNVGFNKGTNEWQNMKRPAMNVSMAKKHIGGICG